MCREDRVSRLLIFGAHPDDAEFFAGGLATRYRRLGRPVKFISVTDGGAGHQAMLPELLIARRREEAKQAAQVIGAENEVWRFPDGQLEPDLELRHEIIREIRTFRPDLVLTHRPCDYHPDHRAVAQAVQDASYLVTVPLICPETPALRRDPVVAYLCDLFTKPYPFEPHICIEIEAELDTIVEMLCQHSSQFYEWLPFNFRLEATFPTDASERKKWLKQWYTSVVEKRWERFRELLGARVGQARRGQLHYLEAFEVSEYATPLSGEQRQRLFPHSF
jgi:N-acetylglucosamine malate deacetylase 1